MTYVNSSDGRISNHISNVVYFSSGRSRRRGGRQHHFTSHPIEITVSLVGKRSREIPLCTIQHRHFPKTHRTAANDLQTSLAKPLNSNFEFSQRYCSIVSWRESSFSHVAEVLMNIHVRNVGATASTIDFFVKNTSVQKCRFLTACAGMTHVENFLPQIATFSQF